MITTPEDVAVKCPHKINGPNWIPFRNNCYSFLLVSSRWEKIISGKNQETCTSLCTTFHFPSTGFCLTGRAANNAHARAFTFQTRTRASWPSEMPRRTTSSRGSWHRSGVWPSSCGWGCRNSKTVCTAWLPSCCLTARLHVGSSLGVGDFSSLFPDAGDHASYFPPATETQLQWYDGTNVQYSNWGNGRMNVKNPFIAALTIDNSWILVSKPSLFFEVRQRTIVACKLDNGQCVPHYVAVHPLRGCPDSFAFCSHPRTKRAVQKVPEGFPEIPHVDLRGPGPDGDLVPGSGRVQHARRTPGEHPRPLSNGTLEFDRQDRRLPSVDWLIEPGRETPAHRS